MLDNPKICGRPKNVRMSQNMFFISDVEFGFGICWNRLADVLHYLQEQFFICDVECGCGICWNRLADVLEDFGRFWRENFGT